MNHDIEGAIFYLKMGSERLIKSLEHVPEEKLTWQPSPTAKSSLQVAAHVGYSNTFMAKIVDDTLPPKEVLEELFRKIDEDVKNASSRKDVIDLIRKTTLEAVKSLEELSDERLASIAKTPFGDMPMSSFIYVTGSHSVSHAAQIDYIQTVYGDIDMHF